MGMPAGDTVLDARDRAILRFFLYSEARLGTGCRLKVGDFHQEGEQSTNPAAWKGDKRRTIGLHYSAAEALQEYIQKEALTGGSLFRPRRNSRIEEQLANRGMDEITMWRIILGYLERLPGAVKEATFADGSTRQACIYTPHSLRATTATLLKQRLGWAAARSAALRIDLQ
jgi:integrase